MTDVQLFVSQNLSFFQLDSSNLQSPIILSVVNVAKKRAVVILGPLLDLDHFGEGAKDAKDAKPSRLSTKDDARYIANTRRLIYISKN